ncbi:MAG TPA: hypothetical protein VGB75_04410 [Jatrophihabitans sp.]|jgi:hypothetical protein|uniref:hypothetical protein n=1 Tax=Jatrophihabitans sp. TaxID=1932789 RepID=UPI002EE7FC43
MNNNRMKAAVGALAGGAALALLGPGAPALAFDSDGLHLEFTVQSPATLVARGAAVDVAVDVECNAQYAYLDIQLTERVGSRIASGYGNTRVTCTGVTQRVLVRVVASSDKSFAKGSAVASAFLYSCTGTVCGSESASTTIKVTK